MADLYGQILRRYVELCCVNDLEVGNELQALSQIRKCDLSLPTLQELKVVVSVGLIAFYLQLS
jgi:hypothetical protein